MSSPKSGAPPARTAGHAPQKSNLAGALRVYNGRDICYSKDGLKLKTRFSLRRAMQKGKERIRKE